MTGTTSRRIATGLAALTVLGAAAVAPGPARADGGVHHVESASDTATTRLVVGYRMGVGRAAMAGKLRGAGLAVRDDAALAKVGAFTVSVPRADQARVTAELRSDPSVRYVEQAGVVRAAVTPDDPYYPYQPELPQITVPQAWSVTTGSAAVTVAVVDTGVSPVGDLVGAVLPGWDFVNDDADAADDKGYGTSEASLIAARGDNGVGMAGVCWACRILPVKVIGADGHGEDTDLAAGIVYAADHAAKIIYTGAIADAPIQPLQDAVAYAQSKGALVVAPAGNSFSSVPQYPAAYSGVIAVGGTNAQSEPYLYCIGTACGGTNYGPSWVDVAAPYCTTAMVLGDTVGYEDLFCGTSPSGALVAGTLALMRSKYPNASASALTYSLTSGARPTVTTDFTQFGEIRAGTSITTVDTTTPTITGATPGQNTRFRGAVTVGATGVSDTGTGVSYAALYVNGTYVGRDTTAPYAVKYANSTSNGTVALQWRVVDRAGNTGTFNRNVIADNKAPVVKITSGPGNGAKVKGTVTLKVAASDASGIRRVELLINGKVVATDTTAAYSFKIKVSKYGKTMEVRVRAVDKVGNTASTATRTWKR